MARKSKATSRRAKVEITPADYRFPGETGIYWTAVASIFILFVWIVAMFLFFKRQASGLPDPRFAYLFLWPVAAVFLANYFSAKPRQEQLKRAGRQARVMPGTHGELYTLVTQCSQLLGLRKPPDLYIVHDDAAYIFSIPGKQGSIIASRPLQDALTQEQFVGLVAREIGLLAAHDVRVWVAITWIQNTSLGVKIGLLPLWLMSMFMRGWTDLVDYTGDRAAVLVVGEGTLNLALLKQAIARDPQADISQEDLETYLKGATDLSADGPQLERHYRIGSFIGTQPELRERIEQIRDFRGTDQGKAAFEKAAQLHNGLSHA